jgi:hypothetical protein
VNFNMTRACVAWSVLFVLARCGGGGDDNNGNDSGNDSSNGNDASNGNDVNSGNDGSSNDSDGQSTTPKAYYGGVYLSETVTKTGTSTSTTYSASAGFYATPDGGVNTSCSGTTYGSCCYVPAGSITGSSTTVSAGGITIKDGTATIATLTPTGTTYSTVTNPTTTALTWMPGDSISVAAAGDTVDAFSGSVTAAALFADVNPTLSYITPTHVPRNADFQPTWTTSSGTNITLSLSTISHGTITCSAADTGTIDVPTAALENFSANDTGTLSIERASSASAADTNATVTLSSSTSAGGSVLFQ